MRTIFHEFAPAVLDPEGKSVHVLTSQGCSEIIGLHRMLSQSRTLGQSIANQFARYVKYVPLLTGHNYDCL